MKVLDGAENKRDAPCQEFRREVTARFVADNNCQEKRFFESANGLLSACESRDSSSTFQPLLAHPALLIIAAYPSSEYRRRNRPQQSLYRNQFFRCAPFNCDYTQP
jgi:hypothetical protein